jgi:flavodoxin I
MPTFATWNTQVNINMENKKIGIFYGSSTGQTEKIAEKLQQLFGEDLAELINVDIASQEDLEKYPYLIFGTPTWGVGEMQDDWEDFAEILEKADLKGKKIALFGLGDQDTYPDSFADGVGILFSKISEKAKIIGKWPKNGYHFHESEALRENKFVGLILDQENQPGKTAERLAKWVEMLKKEFV